MDKIKKILSALTISISLILSSTLNPISPISSIGSISFANVVNETSLFPEVSGDNKNSENSNGFNSPNTSDAFTEEAKRGRGFYLPENMRGVIARPKFDKESGTISLDEPIAKTMDTIASMGMNTVFISTKYGEHSLYELGVNKTDQPDFITTMIKSAKNLGLNLFLTFEIDTDTNINTLIADIHKFSVKYYCDGIVLKNFLPKHSEKSYSRYMSFGGGMGYEAWLEDSAKSLLNAAIETAHLTDSTLPVGLMVDKSGSSIPLNNSDNKSSLALADFIIVDIDNPSKEKTEESEEANKLSFEEISAYWDNICDDTKIPMYINHHNEKLGKDESFNGHDQLLRQLSSAKKGNMYRGSVFNSLPDLVENRLDSTDSLKRFFLSEINEETLFEDLAMHSPISKTFSTSNELAIFQGSYDGNFEVLLNGNPITLNEAGSFYIETPLEVGDNTFKLEHKGQTVTYSIERKVIPLHSIDDAISVGKTLTVDGGTTITIGCIAYKEASVVADINGESIPLEMREQNLDDPSLNASYAYYTAKYKTPDGTVSSSKDLGTITVTATTNGYSRSIEGARIKIARIDPTISTTPIPQINAQLFDQDSAGTGEIVGRIDPVYTPNEAVRFVRIARDNTFVFAADTTGTERNPDLSPLPKGTVDYLSGATGGYYTTKSGKRISTDDANLEDGIGLGENALNVISSGTSGSDSFIKISLGHRTGFNIRPANMTYKTKWGGDFNISEFDASFVFIDFDNLTSVTKLPSFEHNRVFSGGRWETITSPADKLPKFRLVLELRQKGIYHGSYATYNDSGELILTFPSLSNTLTGKNIAIDPGHGLTASGVDFGAIGHIREYDANIAIAKKLCNRLRELGANAYMIPTNENYYPTRDRPDYARKTYDCDLFISLHCNSIAGTNAKGTEVWYYTPFSHSLASDISKSVSSYFENSVYSDKTSQNRGAKYSYYLVTLAQDFPSVLVETGFVTNYEDAMALANSSHQDGVANAIADGIAKYLARSGVVD